MAQLLINLDVPDLKAATAFYTQALGLTIGRQLGPGVLELNGGTSPLYLLEKPASPTGPRSYQRHWTPVHLDWVVDDLDAALTTALAAGAQLERGPDTAIWGRLAVCRDPFGHGFCLLQFLNRGYDELLSAD
ncbi:MAG: VOC family protein [Candidatus Sericytochromatia bacterium]